MKDEAFINQLLQKGREAKEKISLNFSVISLEQLNWQPASTSWSIAQCLGHLIVSHSVYFNDLEKITKRKYRK
ncbi:MAG: DinB family protein [Bacteroidota bacterium]